MYAHDLAERSVQWTQSSNLRQAPEAQVKVVRECMGDHLRLFMDLLLHEVPMVTPLFDEKTRVYRLLSLPFDWVAVDRRSAPDCGARWPNRHP
ncbi:hypothetical protein MPLSOD_330051 [Mesorhizobium sp. SOD10]|nr:hypothetical protein MPLSOD_330051 [Mesorhizobium sp. SOD10]